MNNRLSADSTAYPPVFCTVLRFVLSIVLTVMVGNFALLDAAQAKDMPGAFGDDSQLALTELPKEALQTLALIRSGGPFPNEKDGVVFGNREKQLPKQARGYYTEYTVKTPGAKNRGARRLVVGGAPQTSKEIYYTDDHYQTFKRVKQVDK
jgi:ribonuclease T1